MIKKCLFTAILLISVSAAQAFSVYLAPAMLYQGIKANNVDYQGLFGQLALGLGTSLKDYPLYVGGEIFGNTKPITINNNTQGTAGLKPGYAGGFSFIPGFCLDDQIMLYGRFGMIFSNFTKENTSRHGYQLGGGLLAKLTDKLDIRGEYVYTKYSHIAGVGAPKSDQYDIGLVFPFF